MKLTFSQSRPIERTVLKVGKWNESKPATEMDISCNYY
ncbi:hypothetical protein GGR06_000872 [Bacteroides reticulotermitis]|uniref:Uncharacterized protein n=1 Tax=Bacteroides reticulotermitis TaxID=1133319 RepID=A0A840D303_9BACE|nr:hypothetical protein [Bacteroides reticulotermitis]